jgi:hypothetical protein
MKYCFLGCYSYKYINNQLLNVLLMVCDYAFTGMTGLTNIGDNLHGVTAF